MRSCRSFSTVGRRSCSSTSLFGHLPRTSQTSCSSHVACGVACAGELEIEEDVFARSGSCNTGRVLRAQRQRTWCIITLYFLMASSSLVGKRET